MLIELLKEIAKGETGSQLSLGRKLNMDPEVLRQAFSDLERLGYITGEAQDCTDDDCGECGVCCTKKNKGGKDKTDIDGTAIFRWKLTEKGKDAVRN